MIIPNSELARRFLISSTRKPPQASFPKKKKTKKTFPCLRCDTQERSAIVRPPFTSNVRPTFSSPGPRDTPVKVVWGVLECGPFPPTKSTITGSNQHAQPSSGTRPFPLQPPQKKNTFFPHKTRIIPDRKTRLQNSSHQQRPPATNGPTSSSCTISY